MAPFTVAGKLRNTLTVTYHRIKYTTNSTRYYTSSSSFQNPKPFNTFKKLAALTGASLCLAYAAKSLIYRGYDDGFRWRWGYRPSVSNDDANWDQHGLKPGTTFEIDNLSRFKHYKVSDLQMKNLNRKDQDGKVKALDSRSEFEKLFKDRIFSKSDFEWLIKALENHQSQTFKFVELQGFANPDGTIRLIVYYRGRSWQGPVTDFRCINVSGLHPLVESKQKRAQIVSGMTEKERLVFYKQETIEYQRKVSECKPCLLPNQVTNEIIYMLRGEEELTAGNLMKVYDSVQKWYHDNGYVCAAIVEIRNPHVSELVCEVVEGDITQVVFRFQDKFGNLVQDTRQFEDVTRKLLPKQLDKGGVYNKVAADRYTNDAMELGLFSNVRLTTRSDNKTGWIVDIHFDLKEAIVD